MPWHDPDSEETRVVDSQQSVTALFRESSATPSPKLLRLIFAFEFLLAILAIFTAWSEIGGQAPLDLMNWGWKLGLSVSLAAATVAFTAAIVSQETIWTLRSARWFAAIVALTAAIAMITYYYSLQVDSGDSDETNTTSLSSCLPAQPSPAA